MTTGLRSHFEPAQSLADHVRDVARHAERRLRLLGPLSWQEQLAGAVRDVVRLHDTGKANAAFQRYIAAPVAWRGVPAKKSHAPLSFVLSVALGAHRRWKSARALTVGLTVLGHHQGLASTVREVLTCFGDDWADVLEEQLASLPLAALSSAVDLPDLADALETFGSDVRDVVENAFERVESWLDAFLALPLGDAVQLRFESRAVASVLIAADRSAAAGQMADPDGDADRPLLPPDQLDRFVRGLRSTPLDELRHEAATQVGAALRQTADPLLRLALPTGAGKTLVAARWALAERERALAETGVAPLIVVALPMLSILDQTERTWRRLVESGPGGAVDAPSLSVLASHSLAEPPRSATVDDNEAELILSHWDADIVVTTFDQLLLALFDERTRHTLRYHRLLHARIVFDELQSVPPVLWAPLSAALGATCRLGRTRVLAMSATLPDAIDGAEDVLPDARDLFQRADRYELELDLDEALDPDAFDERVVAACDVALNENRRLLVTLNTRSAAQHVWQTAARHMERRHGPRPILISGDRTPRDRLAAIDRASEARPVVVVSTQCVEAGVDLDVDEVLRDLAPFDALVQIAGRCNRHGERSARGRVRVVRRRGASGREDAALVYDPVVLEATRRTLAGRRRIAEPEVMTLAEAYFGRLAESKYDGAGLLTDFARLKVRLPVRRLLRGDRVRSDFVVPESDATLADEIRGASQLSDRWERRRALRRLSARAAAASVSTSERMAARLACEVVGPWRFLRHGQYDPERGILSAEGADGAARIEEKR